MSLLLAIALASTGAVAPAPGIVGPSVAPNEAWGVRMFISLVPGAPPSCRLELEGALRAWPAIASASECSHHAAEISKGHPKLPRAGAEILVDERFVVSNKPVLPPKPVDWLVLFHFVAMLDIDAAGNLQSCKVSGDGVRPPGLLDLCEMAPKHYAPKKGSLGTPVPFTACLGVGWYIRVDNAGPGNSPASSHSN